MKHIFGNIAIDDINAHYKADGKLFHRISVKNKDLFISVKKALLYVDLEYDEIHKKLIVSQVNVKDLEGFNIKSGKLVWPLNKIVNNFLKKEKERIKHLVNEEAAKIMGKTVENINLKQVLGKVKKTN